MVGAVSAMSLKIAGSSPDEPSSNLSASRGGGVKGLVVDIICSALYPCLDGGLPLARVNCVIFQAFHGSRAMSCPPFSGSKKRAP